MEDEAQNSHVRRLSKIVDDITLVDSSKPVRTQEVTRFEAMLLYPPTILFSVTFELLPGEECSTPLDVR